MSEQEKLKSDDYILIAKWRVIAQFWTPLIAMVAFFMYSVRKADLTFDSQEQKARVISGSMSETDRSKFDYLINDETRHMTLEEKKAIIRMESKLDILLKRNN